MAFLTRNKPLQRQSNTENDNEKLPLVQKPIPPPSRTVHRARWTSFFFVIFALVCLRSVFIYLMLSGWGLQVPTWTKSSNRCVQVEPLHPTHVSPNLTKMDEYLQSPTFRNESIARLSGAVQIRTESFDDMGSVEDDDRWDALFGLSKYLAEQFPLVNRTLHLERVNTHGLLYTWKGLDESLKPTVLMAHQDTVPVPDATRDQWTHDAFSGYYDGKYIWGRGSSDCKNALTSILEAVEQLIQAEFTPQRTLVLSFGFDEEISGPRGAAHLAKHLIDRYGSTGGAAVVVDEGAEAAKRWGTVFATPGVAEKGYIDVEVIIRMPGGHSSIPPPHTGIGVASELISAIEAHPYESYLHDENPVLGLMHCAAEHGLDFPRKLKKLLPRHGSLSPKKNKKLTREASKLGPAVKYLFTTSSAVDIINGGVKSNALPERTTFLINHRVNVGEKTADVRDKLTKLASNIAERHGLALHAFSNVTETPSSITLVPHLVLEPAPITPTSVDSVTPYSILSGTLRALYGKQIIVSPGIMTGNTDTRYYWGLSKHIFRYGPGYDPESEDSFKFIHTVNERISVVNHIRTIQWYSLFIRNMDEADLE